MIDYLIIAYLLGLFTATGIACLVISFGEVECYEEDEADDSIPQE